MFLMINAQSKNVFPQKTTTITSDTNKTLKSLRKNLKFIYAFQILSIRIGSMCEDRM